MSIAITVAGLKVAYPEWENAPDGVANNAVAAANALPLSLYTDADRERLRRYLEAGSLLYSSPFAREMNTDDQKVADPYREQADRMDMRVGSQYRGPGWTTYSGWS